METEVAEKLVRPSCPALDEILGVPFKVLDKGFVRVVDYMGNDGSVVQAARVSYGKGTKKLSEDEGLVRYLFRHSHSTPVEMCEIKLHIRIPMDHWRQMIRHRTACLSGDTLLHFDLPGGIERRGNQRYNLTIKEVFDRFQPTVGSIFGPDLKRDRIQKMQLRSMNEDTGLVEHTNIVDIWQSGTKPVYKVTLSNGTFAKMSKDHLCKTESGWKRLCDVVSLPTLGDSRWSSSERFFSVSRDNDPGVVPTQNVIDPDSEEWRSVVGWEEYYEVSDQGRIRRTVGGRGSRSFGRCKRVTISNGRAVVSLNRPGEQAVHHVHVLMLNAFVGTRPEPGFECCHNDGNALNNTIENLRWDTKLSNSADRIRDGATTSLRAKLYEVQTIECLEEEMTYDMEVSGPFHNFVAGGLVVHNSVNEYSTRYSEAIDDKAETAPDAWRLQSDTNKQGSGGFLTEWPAVKPPPSGFPVFDLSGTPGEHLSAQEKAFHEDAAQLYQHRLAMGVAKEQARKDLPLSTYTEAYWKCDLHNLLHFLSLRMDAHAQQEIRDYANVIGNEIVAKWVPICWAAFNDYHFRRNALLLSARDKIVLWYLLRDDDVAATSRARDFGWLETGLDKSGAAKLKNNRERVEFEKKLGDLGLDAPWSKK